MNRTPLVTTRKALFLSSALIIGTVTVSGSTAAQTAPGNGSGSQAASTGSATLQEVVVTAERHETTLQRTPAAVEVVGAQTLDRQRVVQITDLNTVLNNTQIVPIGTAQQVIIRGIGNNFVDPRADPAVATSINGLFYTRPLPIGFGLLDVARVEDLEGPQGTLYGRNSAAGALNIVTNQPSQQFGGMVQVSGGNLGENEFTGVLNVPVGDRLAFRVAYDRDRRNGYIDNFYDDVHTDTLRGSAKWTPTNRLSIYLETDYNHLGGHGDTPEAYPCAGARPWSGYVPPSCAALPPGGQIPHTGREGSFVDADLLQVDYDFGPVKATSITGFVGTHERSMFPNGTYFTNTYDSNNYDYSEEIRFSGHDTAAHRGGLAWQFGAFFFNSTGDYYFHTQRPFGNTPPTATQGFTKIPQSSEAGYAQATYGITDTLRITGGIRYTSDSKAVDYYSSAYLPPTFTIPTPTTRGTAKADSNKFTYKGGLEFDLAPRNLLYATVSTGYASAGVNGGNPAAPLPPNTAPALFKPETITAYEIGSKNRFLDNRLQLNAAAYYYNFSNYQYLFPSYVQGGGGVHNVQIQNAGSVTAYGVEFNGEFALTPDDRFSASLAFTHGTFGALSFASYSPPATAFTVTLPAGSELVNDPKWSALLGYEHVWHLGSRSKIIFDVNSKLSGKYLLVVGSSVPADYQGAYTKTDLSLAYSWGDRYTLRGWVKNVENSPVNVYGEGLTFNLYGIEPPRTYGATISAKF